MKFFKKKESDGTGLKLNYKRTCIIGFAFFGILLLWQVYDSFCSKFLSRLFLETLNKTDEEQVQYLVGLMMALDNLAALLLLPVFGHLSDKTHSRFGKRMPYIVVGTICCAIAFPFIPLAFHYHSLVGTIVTMAIVVNFAMMYRNPAVALMPDMTPKPLRSSANGIINIIGYMGGACGTVVGMIFAIDDYFKGWISRSSNIWVIEGPFLIASALMLISAAVLVFSVNENKIAIEVADDMKRGDEMTETADKVEDDKPMTKSNLIMLILILVAEFMWFMADNGINTFMVNYCDYHLHAKFSGAMLAVILGGAGSVIGFALGGTISKKIGRKWTVFSGLAITLTGMALWLILSLTLKVPPQKIGKDGPIPNSIPFYIYIIWLIKGFGMSLVHVNSFPMVVELCPNKKIGQFTGYYYASSMAAQTITPIALGSLLLLDGFDWGLLPVYAVVLIAVSGLIFLFVKNVKVDKSKIKTGLEAMDVDD